VPALFPASADILLGAAHTFELPYLFDIREAVASVDSHAPKVRKSTSACLPISACFPGQRQ
jgi:hypothetical protein